MKHLSLALSAILTAALISSCASSQLPHKQEYFGYHNVIIIKETTPAVEQPDSTATVESTVPPSTYDTTIIISKSSGQTTVVLSDQPDVIVVPVVTPWWDYYRYDWYVRDCYWWRPPRVVIIYYWYPWHPITWICPDWWYSPYWHSWYDHHHHHHHHRRRFCGTDYYDDVFAPPLHPAIVRYDAEIEQEVPTLPRLIGSIQQIKGQGQPRKHITPSLTPSPSPVATKISSKGMPAKPAALGDDTPQSSPRPLHPTIPETAASSISTPTVKKGSATGKVRHSEPIGEDNTQSSSGKSISITPALQHPGEGTQTKSKHNIPVIVDQPKRTATKTKLHSSEPQHTTPKHHKRQPQRIDTPKRSTKKPRLQPGSVIRKRSHPTQAPSIGQATRSRTSATKSHRSWRHPQKPRILTEKKSNDRPIPSPVRHRAKPGSTHKDKPADQ